MKKLFVGYLAALLSACAANQPDGSSEVEWSDYSAIEISEKLELGQVSSVDLVNYYLQRIATYDQGGPRINSILALNPNALADAAALDAERTSGNIRSPIHGIPVLLKDNIESMELPTTAGSLALRKNITNRDAPIVARLRQAGAIILGKTNLSEWANFRSEDSVSGWSAVAGQTYNPHDTSRSACGSSSGSGAAMALRLAPLAVGTETNGSVICPSSMNGIVGYKPTVGMLSRTHIVPISPTQDTAGPMTNSVADAALMARIMAGYDPKDPATQQANNFIPDLANITRKRLDGLRIGVMRTAQGNQQSIIDLFDDALVELKALGAELVEITEMGTQEGFGEASYSVLLSEFNHAINEYLASSASTVIHRDLPALIAFNKQSERELAVFDQSIFEKSLTAPAFGSDEYNENLALIKKATRDQGIDKLLAEHNVNLLIAPSYNPAFKIDTVFGDHSPWGWIGIGWMAAIAGYPHVSIPMGTVKHLPVGVSFISGKWQDETVLQVAFAYEQASAKQIKPALLLNNKVSERAAAMLPATSTD